MNAGNDIPEGYEPYSEPSPFLDKVGPLYQKLGPEAPIFAVRILEHHCNNRGLAHGGLLASLADIALGKSSSWSREPKLALLTTSLTIDYLDAARLGDWVEAVTEFYRVGRDLAFANCYLQVGDRKIVRASGVYKIAGER